MHKTLFWASIASLVILLGIELGASYDTASRQIALAVTDGAVVAFLFIIRRSFSEREQALLTMIAIAAALGVWFDALGNFAHLYGKILWWDRVAHGFGAAAATVMAAGLLLRAEVRSRLRMTPGMHMFVAVSIGMLFTVLYEISELIGDELYPALHRITDLHDTADDLRWNLIAAIPAAIIVVAVARRANLISSQNRTEKPSGE